MECVSLKNRNINGMIIIPIMKKELEINYNQDFILTCTNVTYQLNELRRWKSGGKDVPGE